MYPRKVKTKRALQVLNFLLDKKMAGKGPPFSSFFLRIGHELNPKLRDI